MPEMKHGDVLGHETMGEVVEVGADVNNLKRGDRVVVPFTIACGECFFCQRGFFSGCERTNPDHAKVREILAAPAGLFGYSHLLGGYAGGQAEYLRVPYADVGPYKVPEGLTDEQVLFLSDVFPTGYMAAEFCNIQRGEMVAVWGCRPVGTNGDTQRLPSRRGAGHRGRYGPRTTCAGEIRRRGNYRFRSRRMCMSGSRT